MADDNKCAHEACHCMSSEDSDYCSPQCEAAAGADVTELKCECGHAGCGV